MRRRRDANANARKKSAAGNGAVMCSTPVNVHSACSRWTQRGVPARITAWPRSGSATNAGQSPLRVVTTAKFVAPISGPAPCLPRSPITSPTKTPLALAHHAAETGSTVARNARPEPNSGRFRTSRCGRKYRLPRDEALAVLEDQRFASDVRQAEQYWQSQGIQGVPALIFNRRHPVSGAQGVDNFTHILEQLATIRD